MKTGVASSRKRPSPRKPSDPVPSAPEEEPDRPLRQHSPGRTERPGRTQQEVPADRGATEIESTSQGSE